MLEVRDISKRFKSVTALDRVSLRFPEKGLVAILGESGSGKSTLFHVLTGAVKPDGGAVIYNGEKLNTDGKVNGKGIFGKSQRHAIERSHALESFTYIAYF